MESLAFTILAFSFYGPLFAANILIIEGAKNRWAELIVFLATSWAWPFACVSAWVTWRSKSLDEKAHTDIAFFSHKGLWLASVFIYSAACTCILGQLTVPAICLGLWLALGFWQTFTIPIHED